MPVITKISYGNKATVNTGNYENENPMYNISLEVETPKKPTDKQIKNQIQFSKAIVDGFIQEDVARIKNPKKENQFRVDSIGGEVYVHVSDVCSMGESPKIPFIDEYALSGTDLDYAFKRLLRNPTTANAVVRDTPNIKSDTDALIRLISEGWSKSGLVYVDDSIKGVIPALKVIGELDLIVSKNGSYGVLDIKRTKDVNAKYGKMSQLEKYFMQCSAYANFDKLPYKVGFLAILTPYGLYYSDDIEKWYGLFKKQRMEFKERYGI